MKKTKAIFALLIAAALCGCSSNEEGPSLSSVSESASTSSLSAESSSSSSSSTSSSASSTDSSTESKPEESKPSTNETFLKGLAGDTIMKSDIKQVFVPEGQDASVDKMTEENFQSVLCMGFIYAAEPKGIFRTNLDNPDVYNESEMSFSDVSETNDSNYVRLNVGDKMCGMTLTFAETNFAHFEEPNRTGNFFCYGSCEFSGETTLTGYIKVQPEGDFYSVFEGDVIFVPTSGALPVVNYFLNSDNVICHKLMNGADKNLVWCNEYGSICLGNVIENDNLTDFDLPEGDDFVKCRIVIDKLKCTASTQFSARIEANMISFELI